MAKSPWILYGASGKVGNIVIQKNNGQTVIREHVETVKNPRSTDQQKQRMKNATVMAAYSTLKTICNHSFEGVTYGAKSMQYFLKKNYAVLSGLEKPVYNFRQNKSMMPNPLLVSEGSIITGVTEKYDAEQMDNSCFVFPIPLTQKATLTVQQLHDALNLKIGDQFTFIVVGAFKGGATYINGQDSQQQATIELARIIFDPEKANELVFNSAVDEGESFDPANFAAESQVPDGFRVSALPLGESSYITIIPQPTNFITDEFGYALIFSSKENNEWKRSTAHFIPTIGWIAISDPITTYNPSGEKYLNNAIV